MPSATAVITKAVFRRAMAMRNGGFNTYTTTSAGAAGGTTIVATGLANYGEDLIIGRWFLVTSGTNAGQWRRAISFTPSTGTVTVANAYGAQVASAVTFEMYSRDYRPDIISTQSYNNAIPTLHQHGIYRMVTSHIIAGTSRPDGQLGAKYSMPRNMLEVFSITRMGSTIDNDFFDRADSASDPGNGWIASTGTWGVSSERGYSVSDADGDLLLRSEQPSMRDGVIQMLVRGTLNSATDYRIPAIFFRGNDDLSEGLVILLQNGFVDLQKRDAAAWSSITTATTTTTNGVDYVVRVQFIGTSIRVWVDDVETLSHSLLGLNLKYLNYHRYGVRLFKAVAPGTAARFDDYYAFTAIYPHEWHDFEVSGDSSTLQMPAYGRKPPSGILYVEGSGLLSPFAEDTTAQTIATDSTATVQIATTDRAWTKLLTLAEAELYELLSVNIDPETGQLPVAAEAYAARARERRAKAKTMQGMTRPDIGVMRGPQW